MSRWLRPSKPLEDPKIEESQEGLLGRLPSVTDIQRQNVDLRISYKHLQLLTLLLSCIATIACIVSIVVGLQASHTPKTCLRPGSNAMWTMPTVTVAFELDDRFVGGSSPENDQAWNALIPGDGFIQVSKSEARELPLGKPVEGGLVYDISLFHQLHCLASIRGHMLLQQGSIGSNSSAEVQEYLLNPQIGHVYHCFDYLRQSLMCAGDMTIEWPREEEDGSRFAFDGWGVEHQCKDWSAILSFMKEHSPRNVFKAS